MPPPSSPNERPAEPSSELKQIRTYEGDLAEAIEKQNESLVSISRAEKARMASPQEGTTGPSGTRALLLGLSALILLTLGGAGAYYAYNAYKERVAPPTISSEPNQFIPASKVVLFDASTASRQTLLGFILAEGGKARGTNETEQLDLRRGASADAPLLTPADFLLRLNAHAPQPLSRSFGDLFMLGAMGSNPPKFFLIAEVDSFGNAYAGMLEWESRMAEDLLPVFSPLSVESVPSSAAFVDVTLGNRDARALRSADGKTALVYGFFDNIKLIITSDEETFRSIVSRLEAEALKR